MALYLLVGVDVVPWFAQHHSSWAFASFGYVVGFVAAGWLAGRLSEGGADRTAVRSLGLLVLANVVIYAFGVAGLIASAEMGLGTALAKGVAPFPVGDSIKIAATAALLPAAWRLVRARRS